MIADRRRTGAFARAIAEVVAPGDVVLDVGTGTGILAMLAAKAGARRVYGVEHADVAEVAVRLVEANGLADVVRIVRSAARALVLDEKVDVVVSEWLGSLALVEGMLG